jgi:hypothetical protein
MNTLISSYQKYKELIYNKNHLNYLTESFIAAIGNATGASKIYPQHMVLIGS